MHHELTYASLKQQYGGEVIPYDRRDPKNRIMVAGRLDFLPSDFKPSPVVQTAAAKSPILRAAQTKGLDLLHFRFILTTAGANENNQFFVESEISQPDIYLNPIGEPMDQDHDQDFKDICGEIYASEFIGPTADRPCAIRSYCAIFESGSDRNGNPVPLYADVAWKVRVGAGRWAAVSMEAMPNPLEKVGKYLVIHNPKFVGAGLVRFPGNRFSQIDLVAEDPIPEQMITRQAASLRLSMLRAGLGLFSGK